MLEDAQECLELMAALHVQLYSQLVDVVEDSCGKPVREAPTAPLSALNVYLAIFTELFTLLL